MKQMSHILMIHTVQKTAHSIYSKTQTLRNQSLQNSEWLITFGPFLKCFLYKGSKSSEFFILKLWVVTKKVSVQLKTQLLFPDNQKETWFTTVNTSWRDCLKATQTQWMTTTVVQTLDHQTMTLWLVLYLFSSGAQTAGKRQDKVKYRKK